MAERGIVRPVEALHRRHENQHLSAGVGDDVAEHRQRLHVVLDVLEDVHADDGVEPLAAQLGAIAFLEVDRPDGDAVLAAQLFAGAPGAVRVGLDADEPQAGIGLEDLAAHRADAAADFEHVGAEVRPDEAEDVRLIPDRLAHRFEVVGGVRFCVCVNLWSTFMPESGSRDTVPLCYRPSATMLSSFLRAALALAVLAGVQEPAPSLDRRRPANGRAGVVAVADCRRRQPQRAATRAG